MGDEHRLQGAAVSLAAGASAREEGGGATRGSDHMTFSFEPCSFSHHISSQFRSFSIQFSRSSLR